VLYMPLELTWIPSLTGMPALVKLDYSNALILSTGKRSLMLC